MDHNTTKNKSITTGDYTHEIIPSRLLCIVQGKGAVNFASSTLAMTSLITDPQFDPAYSILVDLRQINYIPGYSDLLGIKERLIYLKAALQY